MHPFQYMRRSRAARVLASLMMLLFLSDVLYPTAALALTSGPTQPEFTSFEPVVTTNMVNEFTGDLTYNLPILQIPGPNGGGYAMSLSYHSGASPEEEASWVGYGWTLNPGAINRQRQGIPDDWNGEQMTFYNKGIPNRTVTAGGYLGPEALSLDIPLSADGSVHYNNYNGFGYGIGAGLRFCNGLVSLGFHVNDGEGSFSLAVNPAAMLASKGKEAKDAAEKAQAELKQYPDCDEAKKDYAAKVKNLRRSDAHDERQRQAGQMVSAYGIHALTAQNFPQSGNEMHGVSYKLGLGVNICPGPIEIGSNANFFGQYTSQESAEEIGRSAFGYLHSGSAALSEHDLMDYHSENATPFNKRDKFLPLPVNDADQFIATGEGIMGGMRFYDRRSIPFRPEASKSTTRIVQIGGEINVGDDTGGSVDVGIGHQELNAGGPQPVHGEVEAVLRMNGDMGGSSGYYTYTAPENAHVSASGAPGFQQGSFDTPNNLDQASLDQGARPQASSTVGFHTDKEMLEHAYRSYEKTTFTGMTNGQTEATRTNSEHLGEISVLNEQGQRYNYGLPVHALKDVSMAYHHVNDGVDANDHHFSHYQGSTADSPFKIGSKSDAEYATSFLLTSITDPDYVDRTSDGPTADDLGGYTRFIYARHTHGDGANGGYFNWRTPYEGYAYSDPELSECHDNRISYSAGEKETYYLDRVETRTHVAIFHRSVRQDGLGANANYEGQGGWKDVGQKLARLDRIDLYAKADYEADPQHARPVKSVCFAYANDADGAWPGIPNTTVNGGGKLTLKKVWFEYNGVVPVRISPYEFEYKYPDIDYASHLPDSDVPNMTDPSHDDHHPNETPSYTNWITDPWGNYRQDGEQRYFAEMRPWLDQSPDPGPDPEHPDFDPAAWQLKVIKLPSGGEIHVQYEEDTYAYVQDEKASVMLPLKAMIHDAESDPPADHPQDNGTTTSFIVDVSDLRELGIDPAQARAFQASDIADIIEQVYHQGGRKMYFKFLFGFDQGLPLSGRNGEFISGYVNVTDVSGNDVDRTITITVPSTEHRRPWDVCHDLYNAEKRGKDLGAGCGDGVFTDTHADGSGSARSAITRLGDDAGSFITSVLENPCQKIDPSHCYFRIPVGEEKRGGGTRVKRLLMVDPQGEAEGYPAVFGSEYDYSTTDDGRVISSGVATYEPGGLREENPLVRPLDRLNQGWLDKAIAGRDRKQSEGPEGESLYPSPSIGYSRVVVRNISHGRRAPAFAVKDFNTAKEYPVRVEHTDIDRQEDYLPITTGVVDIIRDNMWASQGYTVHLNEMHGKPKREAEYTGDPDALLADNSVNATLLSFTNYEYFGRDEEVPVLLDAQGTTTTMPLGRTCDMTVESRKVTDDMDDGSVEADIGIGLIGIAIIPGFSVMPTVSHSHTKMSTHTITKVVEHPAILKRTKVYKDGIYHIAENVAFDRNTGEPLVTRTHDGFYDTVTGHDLQLVEGNNGLEEGPGTYTSVTIPASMEYTSMGQAAKGEGMLIRSVCSGTQPGVCLSIVTTSTNTATVQLTPINGASICGLTEAMCVGDLMELTTNSTTGLYHLTGIDQDELHLSKAKASPGTVALGQTLESILILRSGRTNKLREQAGSYTYYGARSMTTPHDTPQEQLIAYLNDQLHNLLHPSDPPLTHQFPSGIALQGTGPYTGPPAITKEVDHWHIVITTPIKCDVAPLDGQFRIDPLTGLIVFGSGDCLDKTVECVQFATPYYPLTTIDNVVASAATEYKDDWPYDPSFMGLWDATTLAGTDVYDLGQRGKWRAASHYAYNVPLTAGTTNKDQGMYPMVLHNWVYPAANDPVRWVRTDNVVAYSPDGNVLEEQDALGHPSCAKFGYDRTLPYLVAKNSVSGSVLFESFEKDYSIGAATYLEDDVSMAWLGTQAVMDGNMAHAGHRSIRSEASIPLLFRSHSIATPLDMSDRSLEVKAWIRSLDDDGNASEPGVPTVSTSCTAGTPTASFTTPLQLIARTGEWELFAATVRIPAGVTQVSLDIACKNPEQHKVWIDDVRIQPVEAQMTSYVYDPKTFRLMATFDDQHFGLYYQYNDEGRLVRKLIETERGIRTVQETQYNTPAVAQ